MGGLLDGARNFFRGFSPTILARPQRFSVCCSEGHRLTGLRTEGYQALRCPTCGAGVFILPRSPLPESAGASSRPHGRSVTAGAGAFDPEPVTLTDPVAPPEGWDADEGDATGDADEIEWVDPPVEGSPADLPAPTAHKPWPDPGELAAEEIESTRARDEKNRGAAAAHAAPAPTPTPASPPKPAQATPRPRRRAVVEEKEEEREVIAAVPAPAVPGEPLGLRLGRWVRARRNLLLFLAVVSVVVATVVFRVRRAWLAELPRVVERGWNEGLPALDAGKLDAARQLLSEARDAVDALGDHSEHASDIRQGAQEIAILTQLCPDTLEALLDQAARSDARDWAEQFDRLYRGRSIIVDAHVTAVRESQAGGHYDLDYRIFRPGEANRPPSSGRIDLDRFTLIDTVKPRVGDRLLFGARLASFKFDLEREEWLIGLEPESGVTMVHPKALEAIGWPAGDGTAEEERP